MKRIFSFLLGIMLCLMIHAQFPYGTTGLLHMPTADMQRDKTVMLGGSFLHEKATPDAWSYNTYNYYINITIFPFLEIGYNCTLFKIAIPGMGLSEKFRNQDRQFSGRLRLLKEGQFWKYMPAVVVGGNDVLTSFSDKGYSNPTESGNGYWNRWYFAATKHANLYGELGIHAAYVYNRRKDYRLNGLAMGANWKPQFHPNLNLMAEYDSRTMNCGLGYTFWKDHINLVTELNDFKYLSAGVYFKIHLK
nr:YjbH domain-containing protein [uncultured Bacteroides sp.]